ncbi:LOW QUALITY PROTEIN: hypothetical protein HID58_015375, partial [Brassica napus]
LDEATKGNRYIHSCFKYFHNDLDVIESNAVKADCCSTGFAFLGGKKCEEGSLQLLLTSLYMHLSTQHVPPPPKRGCDITRSNQNLKTPLLLYTEQTKFIKIAATINPIPYEMFRFFAYQLLILDFQSHWKAHRTSFVITASSLYIAPFGREYVEMGKLKLSSVLF